MTQEPTKTSSQQVPFIDVRPRAGDALQIQLTGSEQRYPSKLIGYIVDKTVLITMPMLGNQLFILREHQTLTVRSFSGTSAYAFNSTISKLYNSPVAYLHVEYPKLVHKVPIRNAARVDFAIAAQVSNLNQSQTSIPQAITIVDLSVSGAAFTANQPIGKKDDQLVLRFSTYVQQIPVAPELPCTIRSVSSADAGVIRYGIQFHDLPLADTLTLQGLVCQKILTEL